MQKAGTGGALFKQASALLKSIADKEKLTMETLEKI
jgi:hypothetical protein